MMGADMNILIINCSPVRNGATAEIVRLVKEYIEDTNKPYGHRILKFHLKTA